MAVFFTRRRTPARPTYVAYIESTGTQYIDTGFAPNQDTRVVMDYDLTSAPEGSHATLFSARGSTTSHTPNSFAVFVKTGFSLIYDQYASAYAEYSASLGGRHIIDKNKNLTILDGTQIKSFTYSAFTSAVQLRLLYDNQPGGGDGHPFGGKLYSCQIYDNDVLVRDFKPCYDPDGVVCLYDAVNGRYHYNAGTGDFLLPQPEPSVEVGTVWVLTEDGEWECPATGNYSIEMHGGGGGAALSCLSLGFGVWYGGATGGGSGEVYNAALMGGSVYTATIGAGGASATVANDRATASEGGTTSFGEWTIAGGGGGSAMSSGTCHAGTARGSLASSGQESSSMINALSGGYGNTSNTSQTYGNGGGATQATNGAQSGQPGAVIITYLGA